MESNDLCPDNDYILVKKSFRQSDRNKANYVPWAAYKLIMFNEHGLVEDAFGYFRVYNSFEHDFRVNYFKIIDKGKALKFALLHGDYVVIPNKY